MKTTDTLDAARIDLLLGELRLPGIKLTWAALAETADKEGWPVARFFPPIRTLHPLPCHRFDAKTRGRSPVR